MNQQSVLARVSYSPDEASETSSIGRTKIFAAMREGKLRYHKSGRRTIILHEDLVEFVKSLPVGQSEAA